eukprot:XP_008185439.2 PREDICTED: limulus clotting factor C-like isoform X2 [Acyrthosiphon pisum]
MKVTYAWLIYSCLFVGSGILCDEKLERRQAVSSCKVNTEDKFYCSNGLCIEWSLVCDGRKDCTDGSDETKELCAPYEYGTNMTTNCGRVYVNYDNLNVSSDKSLNGSLPWMVEIFKLKEVTNSIYSLLCGGSIIAPNIVISAAQCIEQESVLSKYISKKVIKIAVYRNEYFIQMLNVETVYTTNNYSGSSEYQAEDIAVFVLEKIITMGNYAAPVCIDWNSIYNVNNGDRGKIVVWKSENGKKVDVTFESTLPYIDHSTCRKINTDGFNQFVTFDKFCTYNKLGQKVLPEDAGSGISFLHFNSYYLTGIMSLKHIGKNDTVTGLSRNDLINDTVLVFTDIKYHVHWIRGIFNKYFIVNSCILPTVEGVVYTYEGSNNILSHGTLIYHHISVIENCEVGYHKAYTNSIRICLGKGKWLTNFKKLCFKMCPPLVSNSLDIKCTYSGKYTNCSRLSIPDTVAKPSCKQTYIAPNGQDKTPLELLCQSNGTWNKQLYTCNPYCGRVYIQNQVLIENGEKALVGTAPWNVGIYQLNKKNSNFNLICGGSIISPNLVISAAHCFWKKVMLSMKISINDGIYKIAVGKYTRDFSVIDNDFTQIINVEMIHLKDGYYGPTGYHAEDIAIIVLQNRVPFSNGVAPVCIDWNGKYNVVNGDQGKDKE